ncbi:MAG: YraN family protein [Clostridia bacterium]|nr:YraN family protein [Clostridia bacterium]
MRKLTEKRRTGDRGERRTALYLILRGYRILERNYTVGHKEIDLIAKKGRVLAFIEVKTRNDTVNSSPASAVTVKKKRNIIAAAGSYRASHDTSEMTIRYDVSEVPVRGKINYIPNAFTE